MKTPLRTIKHYLTMAKKGKQLEQIVKAVRISTTKNSDALVSTNVKILDSNGINREIDVLEVSGSQKTIFECKELSKAVDIQIIDAVKGKYDDMPEITNRIVISEKGFSKNAKKKADNNCIELFENITIENQEVVDGKVSIFVPVLIDMEFHKFKLGKNGMPKEILDNPDAFPLSIIAKGGEEIMEIIWRGWNLSIMRNLAAKYLQLGKKPFVQSMTLKGWGENSFVMQDALGGEYEINELELYVYIDCIIEELTQSQAKELRSDTSSLGTHSLFSSLNFQDKILAVKTNTDALDLFMKNDNGEYQLPSFRDEVIVNNSYVTPN